MVEICPRCGSGDNESYEIVDYGIYKHTCVDCEEEWVV